MALSKMIRAAAIAVTFAAPLFAAPAMAADLVTYTWTTTSQGQGFPLGQPTSASFQAPLADVLVGEIFQNDITNIQLTYPGLTFDSAVTSSIGLDAAAFVDPTTGAFIYNGDPAAQGLAVIAFAGTDINNISTYLSMTLDNVYNFYGTPLTTVVDEFYAADNYNEASGYATGGYWTATFPTLTTAVPEPSTWAMMILGFFGVGAMVARRRAKDLRTV